MYYSDEIVEEVLGSTNIVDVVSSCVHLQKRGSNYFGLCPFHNEKTASFSVSETKQIFYCFGCGAGGNAATFLMKYENYSFQEALQTLAERAGIKLPEADPSQEARGRQEHRQQLLAVNKETAVYYYRLLRSPKGQRGLRYLQDRGLSAETIRSFGLGFADGARSDLTAYLRSKGFADDLILESGAAVFNEKQGLHDKFWNRVIFPIQDLRGQVIGFGGRVMGDGKPKYLNSPETDVFDKSRNLYGLHLARRSKAPEWILCEGYMDVIAMHQAGFTQAVASLGTAFTQGQAALIKRYVKTVCLAYDSDDAGVRAARRGIGILSEVGLEAKVIDMRPAKDPDEFIGKFGAQAFQERIRDAENSFFFELRMLQGEYRMDDPAQRTAFHRKIAEKLCSFEDEIERENYLREAGARYRISEEALRKAVASYGRIGVGRSPERPPAARVSDPPGNAQIRGAGSGGRMKDTERAGRSRRLLLTWISDEPEIYPLIREYIEPSDFGEGVPGKAAEYLFKAIEAGAEPNCVAAVIGKFEDEDSQAEAAALFEDHLTGVVEKRDREKALRDLVYTVKKEAFARRTFSDGENALSEMLRSRKQLEEIAKLSFSF